MTLLRWERVTSFVGDTTVFQGIWNFRVFFKTAFSLYLKAGSSPKYIFYETDDRIGHGCCLDFTQKV